MADIDVYGRDRIFLKKIVCHSVLYMCNGLMNSILKYVGFARDVHYKGRALNRLSIFIIGAN